jgi:hypothetical protein
MCKRKTRLRSTPPLGSPLNEGPRNARQNTQLFAMSASSHHDPASDAPGRNSQPARRHALKNLRLQTRMAQAVALPTHRRLAGFFKSLSKSVRLRIW